MSNLTEIRKARNVSQVGLAGIVGTDQSHISRIEKGEVVPGTLLAIRIARALDSTVEAVFGGHETATADETPQDAATPTNGERAEDLTPCCAAKKDVAGEFGGSADDLTAGDRCPEER